MMFIPASIRRAFWLFICLAAGAALLAQAPENGQDSARIRIRQARTLSGVMVDTVAIQKLKGNVVVQHDSALIYCDSLYLYERQNRVQTFGRSRMEMHDGLRLSADGMRYDGGTRIAQADRRVELKKDKLRLLTQQIRFFRNDNYGQFYGGGTLYNEADTLTSESGQFYPDRKMAFFRSNVLLRSEEYRIETDTLAYNTDTKTAIFIAPTTITSRDSSVIRTESGSYDTQKRILLLEDNSSLENKEYTVTGKVIRYDDATASGYARGRVTIQPKDSSLRVEGGYGEFFKNEKRSFVTDTAVATQFFDNDTLYITADTLLSYTLEAEQTDSGSVADTAERRIFRAWKPVHFFMNDLQGRTDSLVYRFYDSTIVLYGDPVLWADSSQISGDTIYIYMSGGKVRQMTVWRNAFVALQADSTGFNQIKGKTIRADFEDNELRELFVDANSEMLYFVKDEEKNEYTGLSKTMSQQISIRFLEGKVNRVKNLKDVKIEMKPFWQVADQENLLEGMNWRIAERPGKPESARAFAETYAQRDTLPAQPETRPVPADGEAQDAPDPEKTEQPTPAEIPENKAGGGGE